MFGCALFSKKTLIFFIVCKLPPSSTMEQKFCIKSLTYCSAKLLVFLISRIMTLQWLEGQIPSSYSLFKTKTKSKTKQKKRKGKLKRKFHHMNYLHCISIKLCNCLFCRLLIPLEEVSPLNFYSNYMLY